MKQFNYFALPWLLLILLTASCEQDSSITLKGDIKGLDTKWIYLHSTYPIGSPAIDSAQVINGGFEFKFHADTVFQSKLVGLTYRDKENKSGSLSIMDPNYTKEVHLYADFIMETGVTILTGDLTKSDYIKLAAGKQNEFYFKNIDLPYLRVSRDSIKRERQAARIRGLIKGYPDAYWALFASNNFKYEFSNQQLTSIYDEFSSDIKQSYSGKKLKRFIDAQPKSKADFPNSVLVDAGNKHISLIDHSKKLSMIVFWASWCGPCRREIPSLKKIASAFRTNDLALVSVSIDTDRAAWMKAMKEENMPWQQLIIQPEESETANSKYNLGWVPQIYLVNDKNKVVKKIDGFSEENEPVIKTFISEYLAKN